MVKLWLDVLLSVLTSILDNNISLFIETVVMILLKSFKKNTCLPTKQPRNVHLCKTLQSENINLDAQFTSYLIGNISLHKWLPLLV